MFELPIDLIDSIKEFESKSDEIKSASDMLTEKSTLGRLATNTLSTLNAFDLSTYLFIVHPSEYTRMFGISGWSQSDDQSATVDRPLDSEFEFKIGIQRWNSKLELEVGISNSISNANKERHPTNLTEYHTRQKVLLQRFAKFCKMLLQIEQVHRQSHRDHQKESSEIIFSSSRSMSRSSPSHFKRSKFELQTFCDQV